MPEITINLKSNELEELKELMLLFKCKSIEHCIQKMIQLLTDNDTKNLPTDKIPLSILGDIYDNVFYMAKKKSMYISQIQQYLPHYTRDEIIKHVNRLSNKNPANCYYNVKNETFGVR